MSVDLSTLKLEVDATTGVTTLDRYTKSAEKADRASTLLNDAVGKLAKGFAAYVTVSKFVDETTAAQNSQAQLEAAIKSTGGAAGRSVKQLQDYAATLQTLSTASDDAVQGAQAILLTFQKIKGDTFDAATKAVTDLSTRMGGDLKSAALQVGKALQDPAEGLTALRRSGVSFSDAQQAIIKNLAETGRLAQAQALILRELEKEFGGSAVAARDTFGGALTAVKNAFGDLFEITKDGSRGAIDALNKTAVFLAVLNENRQVLIDVGKYLGIAAAAMYLLGKQAQVTAFYLGAVAGAQMVANFISLARSIGLAAAAVELFSKAGLLRIVSLVASVAFLAASFLGLKKIFGDFTEKYEQFQKTLEKTKETAGSGQLTPSPSVTIVDEKALKHAQDLRAANEDRVRLAKQAYDLVGLEGLAAEKLRIEHETINAIISVRREKLTKPQLDAALRSIEIEKQWKLAAAETNDILERRRDAAKKTMEALNESIRLAVEAGAKAVQQGLDDMKRSQSDAARALLEQADRLKPVVDNFVRDFQSSISSGIDRTLNDGLKSWRSFFDSVKQMFTKLLSDVLASQLMQKAIAPLTGALFPSVARAQNPFAIQSTSSQSLLQGAGIGVAGLGLGYGIGSATGSRTAGILGGAATGAAAGAFLAAPTGGLSVLAGAAIGALTGAIGGLLGASKKGTQEIIAQNAAQEQLNAAMATLRASFSNDALGQQLAAVTAQFSQLRQQTEAAYSGKKNEAERNKVLAELNALEAKRVQVIKDEYAAQQASIQQSQDIRQAIALGRVAEADALDFAKQQHEAYNALVKQGADAATLAKEAETQLLEARKRAADLAEAERRRIFDLTNDTRSISDPRGAAQAAFDEAQAQKYTDAVSRGASAAELAAIASNNLARAAQRAAEIMEADNRVTEGLMNRVFTALGDPRVAQDAAKFSSDRQELTDAIKDGMSPSNIALLRFTEFVEREQVGMQRRIEDGTKAIQAAAAEQIKQKDSEIAAEQARVALSQKGFDDQIAAVKSGADQQIAALDEQRGVLEGILDGVRSQLQAAQEELRISERAYEALSSFANSLNLSAASTLSPTQKLAEAQAQFDLLANQAKAGNADSAANLPAAAQAFLEASRQVNASGTAYASDFARVKQITDALTSQYGGRLTAAQGTVATMEALVESTQKEIDRLDEIKAATKDAADATVAKLQALKEADKAASDALLASLADQKQVISDSVQQQIDALVKVETEAFQARVAASEYYATWQRYTEQQMAAAEEFYRQASEYFSPTSTASGPMPVIIQSSDSVPTSDPELKNVVAELKALVESQQQQIDALNRQIKVSADAAQKTLSELQLVRGAVEGVSSAVKRAGESGMIQ